VAARRNGRPRHQGESLIGCYITDRKTLPSGVTLLDAIARNLAADDPAPAPDWIQIREKDLSARELFNLTRSALALPNPRGVKIIVNTRVDVALAAGAAGAHLPAGSPAPHTWRSIVPAGFLIGVSCHYVAGTGPGRPSKQGETAPGPAAPGSVVPAGSLDDEVRRAAEGDADYALFGPVFAPLSKAGDLAPRGLEELARAAAAVKIPVLALGGITAENQDQCLACGAAGIAGISLYQRNC